MQALLGKITIVGQSFLLAEGRVLGGVQVDDGPPFVFLFSRADKLRIVPIFRRSFSRGVTVQKI
jgi:hypothetical protein